MPKVSLIVPVYNTSKYICKCLESIEEQTLQDIQVVIVDDGSTDNSLELCYKYKIRDSRFEVYHIGNQGPSGARNYAINLCRGKYCMFIDSDDWLEPNSCELLYDVAEHNEADLVIGAHRNEFSNGFEERHLFKKNILFQEETYKNEILVRTLGPIGNSFKNPARLDALTPIWARLYRTSVIKDNNLKFVDLEKIPSECLQFNFDFSYFAKTCVYVDSIVYHYRRNTSASVTKPYRSNLLNKWVYWSHFFKNKYSQEFNDERILDAYHSRICCSIIPLGGNALKLKKHGLIKQECLAFLNNDIISESINHTSFRHCPFYWRAFFYSAKQKRITLFIILTKIMRKLLSFKKK